MTDASGAYIKKYVIGGPLANRGDNITIMHGDLPNYLLRLADVYLVYIEAALGTGASTSDATALNYFNLIRTRAGLATATSLTFDDVFKERRIELALEYQFWFDLKRLHDYNPAKADAVYKSAASQCIYLYSGCCYNRASNYYRLHPHITRCLIRQWRLLLIRCLTQAPVPYY
jgi:hypothetical protein